MTLSTVAPTADLQAYRKRMDEMIATRFSGLFQIEPGLWSAEPDTASIAYSGEGHHFHAQIDAVSFWFQHRNRIFLEAAARHCVAQETLIDVGGGVGSVARAFVAAGRDAMVLEPLSEGARIAHRRGLVVVEGGLGDVNIAPGSCGLMGMFDVLEHIEDHDRAVGAVAEALRPGGFFLIAVPAHRWLWSTVDHESGHYRRYTRGSLRGVLERGGLDVVEMSHFFSFLAPAIFALRAVLSGFGAFSRGATGVAAAKPEKASAHLLPGMIAKGVNFLCEAEARRLAAGRSLPFGSSLFAVARRP